MIDFSVHMPAVGPTGYDYPQKMQALLDDLQIIGNMFDASGNYSGGSVAASSVTSDGDATVNNPTYTGFALNVGSGAAGNPAVGFSSSSDEPFLHLERWDGTATFNGFRLYANNTDGGEMGVYVGTGASRAGQTFSKVAGFTSAQLLLGIASAAADGGRLQVATGANGTQATFRDASVGYAGVISTFAQDSYYSSGASLGSGGAWTARNGAGAGKAAIFSVRGTHTGGAFVWEIGTGLTSGNAFSPSALMSLDAGYLRPGQDNAQTLGDGATRWSVVYAGTGTINTSDGREKDAVRSFTADETAAAMELAGEIGMFKFLEAIAAKGETARLHVGTTVQRAIQIMQAHNLDPFAYGFICYDEWGDIYKDVVSEDGALSREVERHATLRQTVTEQKVEVRNGVPTLVTATEERDVPQFQDVVVVDEFGATVMVDLPEVVDKDGNVVEPATQRPLLHRMPVMETVTERYDKVLVRPAGNRYGFRPEELLLFIARGIHARLCALEGTT